VKKGRRVDKTGVDGKSIAEEKWTEKNSVDGLMAIDGRMLTTNSMALTAFEANSCALGVNRDPRAHSNMMFFYVFRFLLSLCVLPACIMCCLWRNKQGYPVVYGLVWFRFSEPLRGKSSL